MTDQTTNEHSFEEQERVFADSLPEGWERPEKTAPERPYREAWAGTDEEFDAMIANGGVIPDESAPAAMPDTLDEMSKSELQERLEGAGLPISGSKQELVDRLREYNQPGNTPEV